MRARVAASLVMMAAASVAVACGGNSAIDGLTPRQVVVAAATRTAEANSSRFTVGVTISGAEASGDVKVSGRGVFDYGEHRGTMSTTIPAGAGTIALDTVVIGTTVYQKLPPEYAQGTAFGAIKPWLKIDLEGLGSFSGVNLGTLAAAQSADPSQAVAYLYGASTKVEEIDKGELRGDDVVHYRFSVDLNRAAKAAPEELREALSEAAGFYGRAPIPTDAWVDEDGRLRKLTYTVSAANFVFPVDQDQQLAQTKVSTTLELFDFGVEVKAEPPPADQVTDFTKLVEEQEKQDEQPG